MTQLTREQHGAVALIRFADLPGGYMDEETVAELDSLLSDMEEDRATRVLLFTGGLPEIFIRHYSVTKLAALADQLRRRGASFHPDRPAPERGLAPVCRRLEALPKPVIAAINGTCMGGGFEFALACDIRLAAAGDYSIGLPEVNIGILPGAGGTQRLPRLVGMARALEMILRGRTVAPREALSLGMVHEVIERDLLGRALALGAELAAKSPLALGHIKRLVRGTMSPPSPSGLADERTLFLDLLVSDQAVERMARMNRPGGDIRKV